MPFSDSIVDQQNPSDQETLVEFFRLLIEIDREQKLLKKNNLPVL